MSDPYETQRKFPRLNWSVEVRWKKSSGDQNEATPTASTTKDISAGGIRLILSPEVAIGDVLEIELNLGGGRHVRAKGRVAWINKFEITGGREEAGYEGGVEFLDMNDDIRIQINNFVFEVRSKKGTT